MKMEKFRGGLAGEILRADLTSRKISTENTEKYAERFIGGRAISSLILLNEIKPDTSWSDPENMLIFGVGSLVGTLAPGACRVSVDTKNAFNNGKGSANFGGHFGPELKYAGFDNVVITGKADTPVYLWISDSGAELRDASSIWGKTTYQTEEILREELGDNRIEIASIGPAGENLVRGSAIIADCAKAAGGSGVGCVMGSKKLKAIVVRGHGSIRVARPERFFSAVNSTWKKLRESPDIALWRRGIIEAYYFPESPIWNKCDVVRNSQQAYWPLEKRARLVGKEAGIPKYKKKMTACFGCPIGCMPYNEIKEGEYRGTRGTGYWINSANYSVRFDVDNPAASLKYHLLANQLGLDGDNASGVLSWAFECYQRGLLTREDTGGLALEWGNGDVMIKMLENLAYRRGIGDFLADGVQEASRKLGKGSEEFAIHMKGQDSIDSGYRSNKGWGLGLSTSPVGGRHLRGAISTRVAGLDLEELGWVTTEYEKQPEAVFWVARAKEIEDITGICTQPMGSLASINILGPPEIAELVSAATGIELSAEALMLIGRRSINLEKAFNTIHAGFDRKDDYPPRRYMGEAISSGPYAGYICDREKWDEMLDRFYELHGWDKKTGLQTSRGLAELDMADVADKLEQADKLIG